LMHIPQRLTLALGILGIAVWSSVGSVTWAEREEPAATRAPLALVGGRILTQTDAGTITGTVLIRDGKIVAVGPTITIPDDAERIDVRDQVVLPGLIDARSTLWLTPDAAREGASDGSLNVLDGIDPHAQDWKEVVRQGVTAVYVQPASRGILGGCGAVLRVGPAESIADLVIKAEAGAQAALGTLTPPTIPAAAPPTGQRRGGIGPPAPEATPPAAPGASGNALTRYAQYEQLRRALESVKKYEDDWKKYNEATKKDAAAGKSSAEKKEGAAKAGAPQRSTGGAATKPKRDPAKEFLVRVLKGEVPLRLEVHREDDIRNGLRLAEEFKIRVVLDGVSTPLTATETIVRQRLPLVLGPFVELEETPAYRRDRPADWPKALLAQDNHWALGTFTQHPRGSRLLRVQAAAAVALGIPPERVLRALTRDAAEILGVGDQLGTVEPGKRADLVVTAGDPLDPSVPVRLVLSGGKVIHRAEVQPAPATVHVTTVPPLPTRLPKQYALKTQHLVTEEGRFQPGMVLVEQGKVTALGSSLTVPNGVPTFDLGTAVLTPGLVAGPSDLGFGSAIDDPAEADAGQIRAADVYDPQHQPVRKLLAAGFTAVVFAPGSANVIAGTSSGVRLGAAEPVLAEAGVKFVLTAASRSASRLAPTGSDELPTRFFAAGTRSANRYPASLAGQVELVDQALSGKESATELYLPSRVRQQLLAERRRHLTPLLERKQVAFVEAHTRAEVDAALQLIARFQLRGVLVGPEEIRPFLEAIKQLGVGIVARPIHVGDYDRPVQELAEAAAAGVPVAFGSASAKEMRITAALAIDAGMPREAAWRGLTTTAAHLAGLLPSVGRLMVGGSADFVIWDGAPLDLRSRPVRIVVEGKVVQTHLSEH
jgi:imidazolonepropionase-like amidohydrolase